jgi:hypothetical protein
MSSPWQVIFHLEVSHFASRSRQARRLFELAAFFEGALDARNGRAARLLGVSHRRKGRKVVGRKQPNGLIAGDLVSRQILVLKLPRDHGVVVVEEHGRVNALLLSRVNETRTREYRTILKVEHIGLTLLYVRSCRPRPYQM